MKSVPGAGVPRAGLLLLLGLILSLLSAYGALRHPWTSYADCLGDPSSCDGRLVEEFREPRIGTIRADGFELLQRGEAPVFVVADTSGLISGEFVALKAVYHKEGTLTATVVKVASRRREKMIVSLFPAALILFLFFRNFRFSAKRFEFEMRSDA
jgi:hypothetical protein